MTDGPPADVVVRPARPDERDAADFARWLDHAADGTFRTMIGAASERVVAAAYLDLGHDLSYEHVAFAEIDGRSVGMLSAYTGVAHEASSMRPLLRAAGWRSARMAAVGVWMLPMVSFIDRLEPDSYYVQAVAVDPEVRGAGVGSVLLEAAQARARGAGSTRLALDVAEENVRARALYERIGYAVTATSRPVPFVAGSRVHRMVKPLVTAV